MPGSDLSAIIFLLNPALTNLTCSLFSNDTDAYIKLNRSGSL